MRPIGWVLAVGASAWCMGSPVTKPPGTPPAAAPEKAPASSGKFWVYFHDKEALTPEARERALAEIERGYDARALDRRRLRRSAPGLFDERDLPLASASVEGVRATGATLVIESRWLNAASVRATRGQVEAIRELPYVKAVVPVRWSRRCEPITPAENDAGGGFSQRDFYGRASAQLGQMNLPALHARGFTGAGVVIGVLDTGFRTDHAAFNTPGRPLVVIAARDFINNDNSVGIDPGDDPEQHRHGTWILSTIGAYMPNEMVGGAFDASFILCKTEDVTSETPVEEDYYVAGLEFIEQHGGDVATSSLSYSDWYTQGDMNGVTAPTTIAVNVATANGVVCLTAAGNAGNDADPATSRLGAPADAFEVLTCGAVDSAGATAGFSSDGPSADGRVKPEVLARGVGTSVVSSLNTTGFGTVSGTSLSTPLVAAAAACIVQARPEWTPARLRTAVFATASDFIVNNGPDPLFVRGYGIIDANAAIDAFCPSDFNFSGGVPDDADVTAFFAAWNAGHPAADFNRSGGTPDDGDVTAFFAAWGAGC